eukprot:4669831-Heterocapsa_arctica.AAC.2
MAALFAAPDLPTGQALMSMRQESCSAPEAPPPAVLEALHRCPTFAAPLPVIGQAAWVRDLCWHRDALVGTAFSADFRVGSRAFYFLYATQSPLTAYFLPVT